MHHFVKSTAVAAILFAAGADAFGAPMKSRGLAFHGNIARMPITASSTTTTQLFASASFEQQPPVDNEVERLRSMAAKLRVEAASLQAEQSQQVADAIERAFQIFDTNQDGQVTVEELKLGLERKLKTELKDDRVQQLMVEFDASGDGALQLDEFVSVDRFRGRLERMVGNEKAAAREATKQAKLEAESVALLESRMELINDKEPTTTDKLVSTLPYLFPLLDGLQYGGHLLQGQDHNPVVAALAVAFTAYRSIPLSGFLAFLGLTALSENLKLNRQIRFNLQQAIFLDIALVIPGLLASLPSALSGLGVQVPEAATTIGFDVAFVTLVAAIGYSVVSSALGITPDKIPGISQAVQDRMPTLDMFDEEGRFILPNRDGGDEKDQDNK